MAVYAAQIDRMDQGVARLVAELRRSGQLDNTIIFVLSDNGGAAEFLAEDGPMRPGWLADDTPDGRPIHYGNTPDLSPRGAETFQSYDICWANASNTPFRRFKGWVHEGGISTPLIVHWPGGIPSPGIVRTPAPIIDIMPTCLEVAGADYPTHYDRNDITPSEGRSLVPTFTHTLTFPRWTGKQSAIRSYYS